MGAASRLTGGFLPTLVWIGMNPAGAATVLVLVRVVSVLSVTTEVYVVVGASTVFVVKIVVVSVKVSYITSGRASRGIMKDNEP